MLLFFQSRQRHAGGRNNIEFRFERDQDFRMDIDQRHKVFFDIRIPGFEIGPVVGFQIFPAAVIAKGVDRSRSGV